MTDTFVQDIEAYAERVAGGLSKRIDALIVEGEEDLTAIWPFIKAGIALLLSQEGKAALNAEAAAAPAQLADVASGNVAGALTAAGTAVAAAITSTVGANAAADLSTEVQAAQAAGVIPSGT